MVSSRCPLGCSSPSLELTLILTLPLSVSPRKRTLNKNVHSYFTHARCTLYKSTLYKSKFREGLRENMEIRGLVLKSVSCRMKIPTKLKQSLMSFYRKVLLSESLAITTLSLQLFINEVSKSVSHSLFQLQSHHRAR